MGILKRTGTEGALAAIDATLNAEVVMCFCGCERLVDQYSPSMYFAKQTCSEFWHLSQQEPDPEAWRAKCRGAAADLEMHLERHGLLPVERPPRVGDGPTALDALEPYSGRPRRMPQIYPGEAAQWRALLPAQQQSWIDIDRMGVEFHHPGYTPHAVEVDEHRHRTSDHNPEPTRPPETAYSRVRAMVNRVIRRPARLDGRSAAMEEFQAEQRRFTVNLRLAIEDAGLLERLQEEQRRDDERRHAVAYEGWTVTYVDGSAFSDPGGGSTWRVDVGRLSAQVRVGPEDSHHTVVMACVERLREQQRGRLE